MENKSVSRKRSNFYKEKHLFKKKRLKYNMEPIECCYLNTYNPLSRNFNNITMWLNLTLVNISSNMITILPSGFGKLRLVALDLSRNYLGTFSSTKWSWIEQNAIRSSLHFLDISNNFLTKLPFHIGRLNALTILNVSQNMLRSLPQSIGNIQNLNILDMSFNKLLYLPISMLLLKKLEYLDITMNPFRTQKNEQNNEQNNEKSEENNEQNNEQIQSLVILSANVVLQHSIPYDTILPSALVKFLEETEHCFICDRVRMDLLSMYQKLPICILANYVEHSSENHTVQFEAYFCCEDIPISCSYLSR